MIGTRLASISSCSRTKNERDVMVLDFAVFDNETSNLQKVTHQKFNFHPNYLKHELAEK